MEDIGLSKYTAEEIRTIDELIDHIRENIGMYIGESSTPIHLFEECFTNSIDETIARYCDQISIEVDTENNFYTVKDNGRGIPIDNDVPIQISTKFSGAKFQGSKTAYDLVSGKHGVGLVVVNALSLKYEIEIYRDKQYALFEFENGKLINRVVKKYNKKNKPFSTRVSFTPDPKFFDSEVISVEDIRNRCLTASVELSHCDIGLTIDNSETEHISYDKIDYFNNYCVSSDDNIGDIINIQSSDKNESFEVICSWSESGPISPKILSSVNVLPVEDGGTHLNIFGEIIKEVITEKAKKSNYRFQPSDCLVRLRAYLSLYLVQPEFGAQSKDKLTNRKTYFNVLRKKLKRALENYFNNNPEFFNNLLDQFDSYRRSLDSKKLRANASSGRASTKLTKLKDCQRRDGELLICEGDSASGTVINMRDPGIHAVLPLKGKIPSVVNKKEDIIKNQEISDLISAVGTGYGPEFDISKIRYNRIIIFTDADSVSAETLIYYIDENGFIQCNQIKDMRGISDNCYIESYNLNGHKELKKIKQVISHKYNKDTIWTLNLVSGTYEDFTDDHVIYVWNKEKNYVQEKSPTSIDTNNDYLIVPNKRLTVEKEVEIDENLAYLIGNYIGYGDYKYLENDKNNTDVNFALNNLELNSNVDKFIPNKLFSAKENIRKLLLKGLYHSIGRLFKTTYGYKLYFLVSNKQLRNDIYFLLRQFGTMPIIHSGKKYYSIIIKEYGGIDLISDIFDNNTDIKQENVNSNIIPISDDFSAIKINSIEEKPYNYNEVYDLEVEDNHNFPVGSCGCIVHNSDGGHIASLLMVMFAVLTPGIIQNGYLYLVRTPLRAINDPKKGEFTPLWTKEEYDKAVKKKRPITYFKGLGELNPWQLEECALNPENRSLIQVTMPNNVNNIISYFSNVEKKRQLLNDESVGFFNY